MAEEGYSLQSHRKRDEGKGHLDRDSQFVYINEQVVSFQMQGQPVISVDTKKKELVGQFKNAGREWRPQGNPEEVKVYDFVDPELGKAIFTMKDMKSMKGFLVFSFTASCPSCSSW